jgi:uncharacterized protein
MKFQPDTLDGVNPITRQDPGCVWVGSTPFRHSVLVPWRGEVLPWHAATLADLSEAHFERVVAFNPEVVIFGSGTRLQFLPPALMRGLYEARIGIETMDTAAACRTYNVLVAEGRNVLAALLVESPIEPSV